MEQVDKKRVAARAAAEIIESGMRVGLGSGSTAQLFIDELGKRVASGLHVWCTATSEFSAYNARQAGLRVHLMDAEPLDVTVDGADAVDPDAKLIKGRGAAHVHERIIASAARKFVVIIDDSKLVETLYGNVPVEILKFGSKRTLALLKDSGATFSLRYDEYRRPVVSDSGNLIADGEFPPIPDADALAEQLDAMPGVVGHGLFLDMTDLVLVAHDDGSVSEMRGARRTVPA